MMVDLNKTISISTGKSANATEWKHREMPLSKFVGGITKHAVGKKDGKSFVPGVINGNGRRTEGNVRELQAMVFDIDDGTLTEVIECQVATLHGLAAVIYTTHSHTEEKPKHRVVLFLKEPFRIGELETSKAYWKAYRRAVAKRLQFTDDEATDDLARLFYLPRHDEGKPHMARYIEGDYLDLSEYAVDPGVIRKVERKGSATLEQIMNHPVYKALQDQVIRTDGKKVFIHCPEEDMHTTPTNDRDASLFFDDDGGVGFTCLHQHSHLKNGFRHAEFAEWLLREHGVNIRTSRHAVPEDFPAIACCDDGNEKERSSNVINVRHPSLVPKDVEAAIEWFNERYFVVMNGHKVAIGHWEINRERSGKELSLTSDVELFKLYQGVTVLVGDKSKQAARVWFSHPTRKTYMAVVFEPSKPVPKDTLNLWQGFAVEPEPPKDSKTQRGLELVLSHIRVVLADNDPISYDYIMKWTANLFQHPEVVGPTALVLRSGQGTGKSRFTDLLRAILGTHGVQVSKAEQIVGRFNAAIEGKSLVVANETFFAGNHQQTEQLKDLVTESTVLIERKNLDTVQRPNVMKMVITGNKAHIVSPDHDDRRFAIFAVSERYAQDLGYHGPLLDACNDPKVRAAFLDHCLSLPVSYRDLAKIPETQERRAQKALSLQGPRAWVYDLIQDLIGLREELEDNLEGDQESFKPWGMGNHDRIDITWIGHDGVWLPTGSLFLHYQRWCDKQKHGKEGVRLYRNGRSFGAFLKSAGFVRSKRNRSNTDRKRETGYGLNALSQALERIEGGAKHEA